MTINSALNRLLKPVVNEMGLKKKGNVYYRIINDMYQCFSITKQHGCFCNIEFSSLPLCRPMMAHWLNIGTYRLDEVVGLMGCTFDGYYDQNSIDSILSTAQHVFSAIEDNIIPFLKQSDCAKNAFEATLKILGYTNVKDSCEMDDSDANKKSFRSNPMIVRNDILYYMSLKIHDFDFALRYNMYWSTVYNERINVLLENGDYDGAEDNKKFVKHFDEMIKMIEDGDILIIDEMLAETEAKSRAVIESFGWKF